MTDDPEQIGRFVDYIFRFGAGWVYAFIFIACFLENIFPPFPGDTVIAVAGGLVAVDRLDLTASFSLVIAGGMGSVMVMYLLGRRYGRDFFMTRNYRYFSREDILDFERNLDRWGWALMATSRFVVGFRSAIALGAGIARFPAWQMILFSLISYVMFTAVIFYLAMFVVRNLGRIADYFQAYNMIIWPVVVLAIAIIVIRKIRQVRARSKAK